MQWCSLMSSASGEEELAQRDKHLVWRMKENLLMSQLCQLTQLVPLKICTVKRCSSFSLSLRIMILINMAEWISISSSSLWLLLWISIWLQRALISATKVACPVSWAPLRTAFMSTKMWTWINKKRTWWSTYHQWSTCIELLTLIQLSISRGSRI